MNITVKLLEQVHPSKGKYLVARLKEDHSQLDLPIIPAGTIGVIKGTKGSDNVFVFPHCMSKKDMAFTDGDVRIVPWSKLTPIGRVG